ncbi:hypothetical protein, partial [Pseudoalteromonas piscicida]
VQVKAHQKTLYKAVTSCFETALEEEKNLPEDVQGFKSKRIRKHSIKQSLHVLKQPWKKKRICPKMYK